MTGQTADGMSLGRAAQGEIYRDGVTGRMPRIPAEWPALVRAARRAMTHESFAYVAGSAGLENTARANRAAFRRWRITPRVLRDVEQRDLSTRLLGRTRRTPFVLAPIGVLDAAHADADVAVGRAASALGVPAILSNQASRPMEEVAAAMGDGARWFQLYWSSSRELVASFLARAEASGCEAIVVTLDTHVLGWRPRDLSLGYLPFSRGRGIAQYTSDPVFQQLVADRIAGRTRAVADDAGARLRITPTAIRSLVQISRTAPGKFGANLRSPIPRASIETFLDVFADPSLTWDDLDFLRAQTTLPILLKGVMHPDDARHAVDAGVDGIVVSNHGGRQVDGALGALDALPPVVHAVDGRLLVLFDSGIRGGADAFVALALGADAVGIGRPYVYGLAVAGEAGVAEVIRNLSAELDITMAMAGARRIDDVTRDTLTEAG